MFVRAAIEAFVQVVFIGMVFIGIPWIICTIAERWRRNRER